MPRKASSHRKPSPAKLRNIEQEQIDRSREMDLQEERDLIRDNPGAAAFRPPPKAQPRRKHKGE